MESWAQQNEDNISNKLIQRHPHVFGGEKVKDIAEIELNWEILKRGERQVDESLLSSVPEHMPALVYSQSIQRRVASVGFDWEKTEDILDKLVEEVDELVKSPDQDQKAKEFGDLIFTLVNIGRRMDIDLEICEKYPDIHRLLLDGANLAHEGQFWMEKGHKKRADSCFYQAGEKIKRWQLLRKLIS